MRPLPALCLLCACVPAGRSSVELPVVLTAVDRGPWVIDGVEVSLDRAVIQTSDLLVRDDRGRLIAAWAGTRPANLIGQPGPHGTMLLYDGEGVEADFALVGDPALSFAGSLGDGRRFTVETTTSLRVRGVPADLPIDAEAPVARVLWTVDLEVALGEVAWATAPLDDDAAFDAAILAGLSDPSAWRLDADR